MIEERRIVPGECEVRATGSKLAIVGYAAVYGKRSQNLGGFVEEVAPSAFKKTIQEADIRALFNHEPARLLGRNRSGTLRLSSDDTGLYYEIDANPKDPDHVSVVEKIERGDVTGSSFGFRMIDDEWGLTEDEFPLRTLKQVALFDVGPVTYPAYLETDSGLAKRALRSLASSRELPIEDVLAAAGANELRSLIRTEDTPPPIPEITVAPSLAAYRNRLTLLSRNPIPPSL